jgi:hypothetical protein
VELHVVRTAKLGESLGGPHEHTAILGLVDGRTVRKTQAIARIRIGTERFVVDRSDHLCPIRVVRCERCGLDQLAAPGDTDCDGLLTLPDLPAGPYSASNR